VAGLFRPSVTTQVFLSKHCTAGKLQGLTDAGVKDGVDSRKSAALRGMNKEMIALEKELQLVKDASEIYDSLVVVDPKGGRPSRKDYLRAVIHHGVQLRLLVFTGQLSTGE
jgi:hypothetical protein